MNFATPTKIGILGGVSWHSTALYYRYINELYQTLKGDQHSAPLLLNSLDFQWVLDGFKKKKQFFRQLKQELCFLDSIKCSPMLIASNTMHDAFDMLQAAYPQTHWLHLADCVEQHCQKAGFEKIGLIGTKYTMQNNFYKKRFSDTETIVPSAHVECIDQIIGELVQGKANPDAKKKLIFVVHELHRTGAQAVALACTELPILVQQADCSVPLIDTAYIHCQMGIDIYLKNRDGIS